MTKILVGSRAFFSGIDGFRSKDHDYLILVDNPTNFRWRREQSIRGVCTFYYKMENPAEMIQRTLDNGDALLIGKFLVPEVAQTIGLTIDDLCRLEPLLDKLDDNHQYETVIFNAYKENGSFTMTANQLKQAYKAYQQPREKNRNSSQQHITDNNIVSANLG